MKEIIVLFMFVYSATSVSQSGILTGKVKDDKGLGLEFVNVFLSNIEKGASTNIKGEFEIKDISYGTYKVVVSSLGYETQTKVVVVSSSTTALNFELKSSIQYHLNEFTVSGTLKEVSKLDSPVPVEVYTKDYFKANPTASIYESVQQVNGVRPQLNCNVCNTGDIHINGLEGAYTVVLIDGMPIVSGLSTVYGLTGIPQSLIERVEIVKGPSSTLYGSEAVGGIINVITKKPTNAPIVSVDAFATSWGEVNTDIGVKFGRKKVSSLLGINYFKYGNPIDNNNDNFTDVTLQDRISIFNKINIERKDGKVFSLAGRYNYEDRWGGEMNWDKPFRGGDSIYGESIYTNRWELLGVYQLPIKEDVKFYISGNGHYQNSVYGDLSFNAAQHIGFGQVTWSKDLTNHSMLLGASYRYIHYDDNTTATEQIDTLASTNAPSITTLPGVFLQDEWIFNRKNKLLMGLRYDYNNIHGNIFSPRLNYKWNTLDKKSTIRLSLGNGYRVVNVFTEDHAALTGARDVVIEEELKPETSWNGNINIVQKFYINNETFLGLDFSSFYTYFDNRIIADYDTDVNKIIYDNLDGFGESMGVSLNIDLAMSNGLKITAGATYQEVTTTENGVKEFQILTERFSGVWNIGYTWDKVGLTFDYTGKAYGPMRLPLLGELDNRDEYSPLFSIQNIQVTKKFKKGWEIYGGIKNILNFTPPANSISRPFDPFDRNVVFDSDGNAVATNDNPNALTFDPAYVYAPNQGIRGFLGFRYIFN